MKKSKMIHAIEYIISTSVLAGHDAQNEEVAKDILAVIELSGMLPPAMDYYQEKHYNKEEVELASDMVFTWEPEE